MISVTSPSSKSRLSKRNLSFAMGLVMLSLVLVMLWLSHWLKKQTHETVMIREISTVALPPPPPPPPKQKQTSQSKTLTVKVNGQGAMLQNLNVEPPPLDEFQAPDMQIDPMDTQWQSLEVDWQAFDLDSLDSLPTLLTPLRVRFPKSLSRRGVNKALIKLDVLIDEKGHVTLISVASNPYPELASAIQKLVRGSRFSPPQKDEQPARARFIWPIDIKA